MTSIRHRSNRSQSQPKLNREHAETTKKKLFRSAAWTARTYQA
jgi:hypothetical protein